MLASLQPATLSAAQGWRTGAPDLLRAGLADPPEYWPAASLCDAARRDYVRVRNFWLM